jgi:STE24 endopeptidase
MEPFSVEQIERARRYHRPLYRLAVVSLAIDLTVLALLSFGTVGDTVYRATTGWPWWARAIAFALLVLTLMFLIDAPAAFWSGYFHEHAWGFSTQSPAGWLLDRAKGLAVSLVLGGCALVGFVAAAHLWPSWWPVPVGLAAAGLVLLLGLVAPLVLEPLFNRFEPLPDREQAAALQELADRAGVPIRDVLVADASRRTRKVNAYVSGLGRTRRVVIYDTLLGEAHTRELRLVVAHELGHRRARHVEKGAALSMLGAAVFVVAAWALLGSSAVRSAIGARDAGDPRVIPFLLLLASVLGLVASPFGSALSRRWERQADAFSLALTVDREAFVSTHRRLGVSNLADLDPPRLAYWAWFSHPTPPERIRSTYAIPAPPAAPGRLGHESGAGGATPG